MQIDNFEQLADQVLDNPLLTGEEQEQKIIQLADVSRFITDYNPHLQVLDITDKQFILIDDQGIRKGIALCDSVTMFQTNRDSIFNPEAIDNFKIKQSITDMWLVYIEDAFTQNEHVFSRFLNKAKIETRYNKIFTFHFFQAHLQILK